ncbi:hypothetical protein L9F63_023371, partial [Diploptera punctata]
YLVFQVTMLYIARFIMDLSAGASGSVVPLYTEEISQTNIRGELGSYLGVSITIGILYVYAFGAFVPYIWLCIASLAVPLVFAVTFFWMPESPMYLLSKGRKVEAEKSLRWLHNISAEDSFEIEALLVEMEQSLKKPRNNSKFFSNFTKSSPVLKTTCLVIGLMIFQQLSGINGVISYTVDIFKAAGSTLSPYYCTLILGVVQVASNVIGSLLMDRLGRRFILLTSGAGMAASHLILSGFSLANNLGGDVSFVNWVPLLGLNLFVMCFSIGFGPVPWFMMVELSTSETRGWISSLGAFSNWTMVFLMTKVFTLMLTQWGQAITYGILCGFCVIATVFIFTCIPMLYSARFILGLATGASTVVVPLYTEEISETSIRGELGSYLDVAITIGILYVYAFGAFVPYIWLCIASIVVPLVLAVTFFWMPETPMYILSKGRKLEAEKSLRWLRNISTLHNSDIEVELIEMEKNSNKPRDNTKFFSNFTTNSPVLKSLFLVLGLMAFEQLSGVYAVEFYTVDIFKAAGSKLSPYYCTLIVGVVQAIATFTAALLMDRAGFSFAKDLGYDETYFNWIPLVAFNLYIVCFSIGFGPIPWFMMVELSTSETRGWISSLAVSFNWGMVFLMTKVFTLMLTQWGQAVTYGILCAICVIGSVFVFTCIPETKGKSREEIQAVLSGK